MRAAGKVPVVMPVTLKDFYADWCGPCKTQDPIIEELTEEYPDVAFEKVNVDEEQEVANEYQVRSLPTLIVDRKSTRLNSSHIQKSRMPSSA